MKANTILDAIRFNDLEQFKALLPNASTKQLREALVSAASRGRNQYISLLLPVQSKVKREALLEAVRMGNLSSVPLLLPQRMRDSEALCCAIRSSQKEVFDFLLPLTPLASYNFMALRACLHETSQNLALFKTVLEHANMLYPNQLRQNFHHMVSEAVYRKDVKALDVLMTHEMFSTFSSVDMSSAVKNNDTHCVQRILPYASEDSCSAALEWIAIRNCNIEIVKMLLEKADARLNNSAALQYACVSKNAPAFDLLYPLSDPHAALYELQKRYTDTHWRILEERIQQDLRQALYKQTAQECKKSSTSFRKM